MDKLTSDCKVRQAESHGVSAMESRFMADIKWSRVLLSNLKVILNDLSCRLLFSYKVFAFYCIFEKHRGWKVFGIDIVPQCLSLVITYALNFFHS